MRKSKIIAGEIELSDDQSVEPVVASELGQGVEEEAFMNEPVTVLLAETTDENLNPMPVLSVNGTCQPLLRGVPTVIKRKYVEVLARCKETKYNQRTANPMEPDRIEMVARTALSYPFQVIDDKNPKGATWLRGVLAEAA